MHKIREVISLPLFILLLGVESCKSTGQYSGNIDQLTSFGQYAVSATASGTKPANVGFCMIILSNGDYVAQLAITIDDNLMYYRTKLNRTGQTWKAWKTVS